MPPVARVRKLVLAFAGALVCAFAAAPAARAGDWLAVKNENPLLRGLYLPMPVVSRLGDPAAAAAALGIANTTNIQAHGSERLLMDGEAAVLHLSYDTRVAERWRMRLSLPLVEDSAGRLDSIIDRWHGWFSLPRGSRRFRPRNQLDYDYQGVSRLSLTRAHTGIGDAAVEAGWYAVEDARRELAFWGGLEAPTGSARELTGDDAWDASLWVHAGWYRARWRFGAEAGVLQAFGDELFGGKARRTAAFGRAMAGRTLGSDWLLQVQLEAQSARIHDTGLRFLGPSLLGSAGLMRRIGRRWEIQGGFAEDLAANTAPDFTLFLGVRRLAGLP